MTDDSPHTVKVQIFNDTFSIVVSDGNDDRIQELATIVEKRMREIASAGSTIDSRKVAILTALNLADELYRIKAEHERLDRNLAERSAECANLLDQLLKPRNL
jgi:cell division protein ZapA